MSTYIYTPMLTKLSSFFYQKSSLLVCLLMTAITFWYLYFVLVDAAACYAVADSTVSLGTSFWYGREMLEQFFWARTPQMIACYQELLIVWDGIFALLYGTMYVCWITYIYRPYMSKVSILNLLPFLQTIFDRWENTILNQLADTYMSGELMQWFVIYTSSIFTMVKRVIYILVFVVILYGIYMRVRDRYKKKN